MIRHLFTAMLAALAMATASGVAAATDVNRASVAELEAVKGIGPALSAKITRARQQAPFKDWSDLVDRVPGLGASHARRFSEAGLTVAGAAYVPAASPAAVDRKSRTAKPASASAPAAEAAAPTARPARAARSVDEQPPAKAKTGAVAPRS